MRISDWSSDVCSADLRTPVEQPRLQLVSGGDIGVRIVEQRQPRALLALAGKGQVADGGAVYLLGRIEAPDARQQITERQHPRDRQVGKPEGGGNIGHVAALLHQRSEEHTSELQSLMRISYAVFCLKKKNTNIRHNHNIH